MIKVDFSKISEIKVLFREFQSFVPDDLVFDSETGAFFHFDQNLGLTDPAATEKIIGAKIELGSGKGQLHFLKIGFLSGN